MAKNLRDIYVGVNKGSRDRNKNDLYETPPLPVFILDKLTNIPNTVIEPCAGRGNISAELIRRGKDVRSYDLYDYDYAKTNVITGVDVLECERSPNIQALITNPPYHKNMPMKVLKKAINDGYEYIALFLRLTFLESKSRNSLFTSNSPNHIIFLSDRVRFTSEYLPGEAVEKKHQIGGMIAYAWYVWDRNAAHENTKLDWVLLEDYYDEWRQTYDEWRNKQNG